MNYNLLGDTTAVVHFITIVMVIVGLLISFRYKRFRPWEAAVLLIVVVLWSYYGNCPLTILEEHLRTLAGNPSGITNIGFLPFYAEKLLDMSITSKTVQRSTFFIGGMIFTGSLEWLAPILHIEIFRIRHMFRKIFKKSRKRYA